MTAITKISDTAIITVEYFSDAVIDAFVASRHGSTSTKKTYRNACRALVKFFTKNGITAPTTADVDNYVNNLRGENKSAATLRLYTTVTKMFFSFLEKQGIYRDVAHDIAPLKIKKSQTHKRDALTIEQAQKLLASVKGDDMKSLRDRAIIALCLQCGLRTIEVERMNCEDLTDCGEFSLLRVQGKGRLSKDDFVKVSPVVAGLIRAYWSVRGDDVQSNAPAFTSTSRNRSNGRRLSAQSIGKLIKNYMRSCGIDSKRLSAHSTRHFCATCAIQQGVDIREVSQMLRHSSLNVTLCYLHDISLQTRRAEMAVADSLFGGAA